MCYIDIKMSIEDKIKSLVETDNGYLRVKLAESHGIARAYVYEFLKRNPSYQKIAAGIYYNAVRIRPDMLYVLACRNPGIVYSHMTAVHIHKLATTPEFYDITVKQGYSTLHFGNLVDRTVIHQISSPKVLTLGKERIFDPLGNVVPVYNMERTICDLLRTKNCYSQKAFSQTMMRYFQSCSEDNMDLLLQYADQLKVQEELNLCLALFGKMHLINK